MAEEKEGLEAMSRPELVSVASKKGIPDATKMNKQELLEALAPVEAQITAEGDEEVLVFAAEEDQPKEGDAPVVPDYYPSPYGRRVVQKAVLYTDGTSGVAELNHERAYEYNERLQSSDSNERRTGDVSVSEAAKAARSQEEELQAERAKQGYVQ